MEYKAFPRCRKCGTGYLLPMSDFGRDGSNIPYKAWICANQECTFHFRIDSGGVTIGEKLPIPQEEG